MKKAIRNLIVGKDVYIESRNEFHRVMLSGHFGLLSLLVISFYLILDFSFRPSLLIFIAALELILTSLILHRYRKHCLANYFLFPTLNILLFALASSESVDTGAFVFFIPISLGSFAVFNYTQRRVAIAFASISAILFILTIMGGFSILEFRNFSDSYIQLRQLINFSLAFPVSLVAVYLLISLNHHNATQLIQGNKQMKKLNQELDRFVYSTSHDLRAPLLSVLGLLQLAENSSSKTEMKKYHEMMQTRVLSLDNFIKDITDYSRNNRLEIVREDVNLAEVSTDIWESLKYSADAKGIEFINEIPNNLVVANDGTRLRVVLSNLIANAIRYHDRSKENKYIRVYHQLTATSFSLHIEDNGQGIAPEFQSKIFDMFFRASESSQGSGLGLYIVKETLAKLSGSIQLTSIPQQGSTFSISLAQ